MKITKYDKVFVELSRSEAQRLANVRPIKAIDSTVIEQISEGMRIASEVTEDESLKFQYEFARSQFYQFLKQDIFEEESPK